MNAMTAAIQVDDNLTIYTSLELKPRLLASALAADVPTFDLSHVQEIDSAGLQLLLLVRRELAALGRTLAISGASPAVEEAFAVVGMDDWLRAGMATHGTEGAR